MTERIFIPFILFGAYYVPGTMVDAQGLKANKETQSLKLLELTDYCVQMRPEEEKNEAARAGQRF